jgi:phospholipid/cholesterol/gamma-HCH transport system substrate-binding protein
MATAIRKNLRNFLAIAGLVIIAGAVSLYILQNQRLRIPILEEKPFELKAEFETAQAVVPGQGQTIRVAGVRIGDVQDVEVEDGVGVVTFAIEREFLPVYKDATILMRPLTGLKDMFFQLDPGTSAAGEYEEGETVPVSNTAPDVNLDEILEALDSDTQAYLKMLLVGAGQGLKGRDEDLGKVLGGLGPINRDLERLNTEVAKRQANIRNLVHNFNILTGRVAQADDDLIQLVSTSNSALGAIAEQDPSVRRSVELLGPTLAQAESTLNEVATFADVLGPTFNDLRPFARNLDEANASLETLARNATPVIRDEIRPFVRAARKPVPDLRRAADRYSSAAPRLTVVGKKLNKLTNMAAWNPDVDDDGNGQDPTGTPNRNEGYLFWAGWLGHNGNLLFNTADGNGPFRRIYFTAGCNQLVNILTGGSGGLVPTPPAGGQELNALLQQTRGLISGFGTLFQPGGLCD